MRLHKFISRAGVASRRHAEELIRQGRVTVNGERATAGGRIIDPLRDAVCVDGKAIEGAAEKTTIVLNKPPGVMTTTSDPEGRRTVRDIIRDEPVRLVPVGRLDYHTEGVLLMTSDGELMHRLLHPRYKIPKVYVVRVRGTLDPRALDALRNGVELDDGRTQPATVEVISEDERDTWLEMILSEGRQRQIRRMVEAVGHQALRVVRTSFASIGADELAPGQYRYLSRPELSRLYDLAEIHEGIPGLSARAKAVGTNALGEKERSKGPLPGAGGRPRTHPSKNVRGPEARRRDFFAAQAPSGKRATTSKAEPRRERSRPAQQTVQETKGRRALWWERNKDRVRAFERSDSASFRPKTKEVPAVPRASRERTRWDDDLARGRSRGPSRGATRGPSRGATRGPSRGATRGPSRRTTRGPRRTR